MAVVAFVGCDKTGKSTLFQNVLKKTNRHICIDRFTACQFVYGNYHKKGHPDLTYLRKSEDALNSIGGFFVYVTADPEDIKKRFKEHNETDIDVDHISFVQDEYEKYLINAHMPVIKINTSELSIDEAVEEILVFANATDIMFGVIE